MPRPTQDTARVVSVRLPDDLFQRLDRLLDWGASARRCPPTRNAAIREALRTWLDDYEQRAGLVAPHTLQQPFQAAYRSLRPHQAGVPIHQLRRLLPWPRERFDAVLEARRAAHQVDLEVGTAHELSPHALADSYQVHGQLSSRVRWRA